METLKDSLIKKIELIKKFQEIRSNKILEEENNQIIYSNNIKLQLDELEKEIEVLQKNVFNLQKQNLDIKKDYLLEEEYTKNEMILNNNNKIKIYNNEIKLLDEKIYLTNKYYEKQLDIQLLKDKSEKDKLNCIEKEKKYKKTQINEKFEMIKKEKSYDYQELINRKNDLIDKKYYLKNQVFIDKEQNLKTRFININTIMKYSNEIKNFKKKGKEYEKKIKETKYELDNFENNIYYLEKEKILLGLKNNLLQNEEQFKINFISQEKYFSNSKEINKSYEIKLKELNDKLNKLKTYNKRINNGYIQFKTYSTLINKSLGNQIKKSNNKYEEIKKYEKELKDLNYKLNEYDIISNNIDNLRETEIDKLNDDYNKLYIIKKYEYDNVQKETIRLEKEKTEKLGNIKLEKDKYLNKISYFEYSNHNLNITYELKVNNYIDNIKNKDKDLEKYNVDLEEKKNLLEYKKNRFQKYNDNYDFNKLKKETDNNNLLIKELLQIQELNKQIDELQ